MSTQRIVHHVTFFCHERDWEKLRGRYVAPEAGERIVSTESRIENVNAILAAAR
jgi:hypothetical protein